MCSSAGKVIIGLGIITLAVWVIIFDVGSSTETITCYQGANGKYYTEPLKALCFLKIFPQFILFLLTIINHYDII